LHRDKKEISRDEGGEVGGEDERKNGREGKRK
jgi:hypothetical protein